MGWAFWTGVRLPSSPPKTTAVMKSYSLFISKLTFIDLFYIIVYNINVNYRRGNYDKTGNWSGKL